MAYVTATVEGGLFPADLLERIALGDVEGQRPIEFGLPAGARLSDAMQAEFSDLCAFWDTFQRRRAHSRESSTRLTREAFAIPLLESLGFALTFQRSAAQVGDESYPISHRAGDNPEAPPVHIVSIEQSLDRKAEGARRSPYALLQEYLNRSDAVWGIVTNGEHMRLLRASAKLAGPTYLDFNLRAMVEGNQYSEFVLLYRLLHRTRLPQGSADAPECRLERYYQQGIEEGGRVRDRLRDGVEAALRELGTAFLAHPDSGALREDCQTGRLSADLYYRELLRLVYRLLFLFVVEERRLIFPPEVEQADRQRIYAEHYSVSRLRERCERYFAEDQHGDLWQGLLQTCYLLRDSDAARQLGLAALDGELFGVDACRDLEKAGCENARLLAALRSLSTFRDKRVQRRVNYGALDVEELGSVYESLLDYRPHVTRDDPPRFELLAGSERKQTGSYYTPPELVHELIESALVPVVMERLAGAASKEDKERALLSLRACDPASGSGHFLLAAARRIGRELARVRSGEEEPPPDVYRVAVRDVIRNCIYAVDKNPLAVDLCKVALWIESHNAGLPLSFLDHHVKCGDSLVGVFDLKVLRAGIPDEAYTPVTGDDRQAAAYYKKRNKAEREGQRSLDAALATRTAPEAPGELATEFAALAELEDRTPDDVHAKQQLYATLRGGQAWHDLKAACDLWTAAFFVTLKPPVGHATEVVPTTEIVWRYLAQPRAASGRLVGEVEALAERQRFFHWPLEFPEVFAEAGFDVVVGNPPFLGGVKISATLGSSFRKFIAWACNPFKGQADLCAAFFRRGFDLFRLNGSLGMVATNTIGQGDTREAGLATIIDRSGVLVFARRFIKWPGAANVEVDLVALAKGMDRRVRTLDGGPVDFISSRLDSEPETKAICLDANEGKGFRGQSIGGDGFIIEPDEAANLLRKDARNRQCLFLYLTGEDLNGRPDQSPSRWIICFFDWPLSKARSYPDVFRIVEDRVKPQRQHSHSEHERRQWWQFARPGTDMRNAITPLKRVLVRSRVSENHMLGFVPTSYIFGDAVVVLAFDDEYDFGVLQSSIHEAWVRRNSSTLRTDVRYTPSDCFDNFPFPQAPPQQDRDWTAEVARMYHESRRQTVLDRNLGLTKTYNLFHAQDCRDEDIVRLRDLHEEMDEAILACYGWRDIDLGHDFCRNDRGQIRYTVSPNACREILRRLLELNQRVAQQERARGSIRPVGRPQC